MDRMAAAGRVVVGVDLVADPSRRVIAGDISSPGGWQDAFSGAEIAVHTAALVSMSAPRDRARFWRVNAVGTRSVLDTARRCGVRRVVVLSSIVVFGNDFPDQVDESYPVRPTGVPYTDTKIACEQIALAAHAQDGLEVTVVRPGDVYGPGSVWIDQPLDMMRRGVFWLPARGRGVFSPVHLDDVVAGIAAAAESTHASGQVITLSGGVGVTTADFFGRVAALDGRRAAPAVPTPLLSAASAVSTAWAVGRGRPTRLSVDAVRYLAERRGTYGIGKARDVLGWRPVVSLDEGMTRLRAVREARGRNGDHVRR